MAMIINGQINNNNTELIDQHNVITLDLETRRFTWPSDYKIVAIIGDSNSQKLTFEVPTEYDGVPLIGTTCVLTYWTSWTDDNKIHSKGSISLKPIEVETEKGKKLHYTWVLDPHQTAKSGEVKFKLGFYLNLDDDFYYDYSNYQELVFYNNNGVITIEYNNEIIGTTYKYYALTSNSGFFQVIPDGIGMGSEIHFVDKAQEFDERISAIENTPIKTINGESIIGDGDIQIGSTGMISVDQSYSPESKNAQSGKAVAEAIKEGIAGMATTDQVYNPTSTNAQSGKAVEEAFSLSFDYVGTSANILPPVCEVGGYNVTTLEKIANPTWRRTPNPVKLMPYGVGYTYLFATINAETINSGDKLYVIFIDENGAYIKHIGYTPTTPEFLGSIGVPSNAVSFVAYSTNNIDLSNFCLSYTAKTYEAYKEGRRVLKEEATNTEVIKAMIDEALTTSNTLAGKTIVNFGDSIFGMKQDLEGENKSISSMIADMTGATVYNCAFSGCKMAYYTGNTQQLFCMPKLADAITSNDYSLQEEAMNNWTDANDGHRQSFATLKTVDFNNVDIITIAYGTNDYSVGIDVDRENNPKDIYCFGSALRYSIEKILATYPHIKIFVCTPTFRFWLTNGEYTDSDTKENTDGSLLTDYVKKVKEVCDEYHLPCIDNYSNVGINKFTRFAYFPDGDTTHHNLAGRYLLANHIVKEIQMYEGDNCNKGDKDENNTSVDQTYNPESSNAQSGKAVAEALASFSGGNNGVWETIADITIPEGFSSYNYTITEATYPDMTRITDFYIEISVPKQSEGVISGALQVQAKANTMTNSYTNIARFDTWNHANYIMKGALFSKLFGDKRHNQYYGLAANATQSLANNSLLGGLNVGYFKELNFALSDTTKTLPVGTTIRIVGCKA